MKRAGEGVGWGREKITETETVLARFGKKRKIGETNTAKSDDKYKLYLVYIGPFGQALC